MDKHYRPDLIEQEIQAIWQDTGIYTRQDVAKEPKSYTLCMLPYPSGDIHMGHVSNYTFGDVVARWQMFQGIDVLQPMGWDAFGLPAENAAISKQQHPMQWTLANIDRMKQQLIQMGLAIDWTREIKTCDKSYYHWQQWLFLQMFNQGLAYRKKTSVNWDPVDQTVLANEQVIDGKGWRSGAPVEQKEVHSWFLKITQYADELTDALDDLPDWPERVKTMQKNWIGRSEGTVITFTLADESYAVKQLECFTTRADTLMGCTYVVISPQHPLAQEIAKSNPLVKAFIDNDQEMDVKEQTRARLEKTGVSTSTYVKHPITGESIPLWLGNYVVMSYGSGAVMAVPAHDERDYEFAQKYALPIKTVIKTTDSNDDSACVEDGTTIHSGDFTGLTSQQARKAITERLIELNRGGYSKQFRLRDWGISRQRYWGCPIPIIYCDHCGTVPVPEADLPVELPTDVDYQPHTNLLKSIPDFYQVKCPICQRDAVRETDTFDTFVDSSWYFTRYLCPQANSMLEPSAASWLPVDLYIGGIEHAVMHLLYARFVFKVLRDLQLVTASEPFKRYFPQGMVLKDGAKMSKSKGNVVDPTDLIETYGADTIRVYMMFTSPPDQSLEWCDAGVDGVFKFLKRLWHFSYQFQTTVKPTSSPAVSTVSPVAFEQLIQQANRDIEKLQLNTVISACMKMMNSLQTINYASDLDAYGHCRHYLGQLLILLNPFAPHITTKIWHCLAYEGAIHEQPWPTANQTILRDSLVNCVIQVNGKVKAQLQITRDEQEDAVFELAKQDEKIASIIANRSIKKIIYIPNRLMNVVVAG